MIKLMSILSNVVFFVAFSCFILGFYQQAMFVREWSEDHASHLDRPTRTLFSTLAMFYSPLSERCRSRRGKVLIALASAIFLVLSWVGLQVFLNR